MTEGARAESSFQGRGRTTRFCAPSVTAFGRATSPVSLRETGEEDGGDASIIIRAGSIVATRILTLLALLAPLVLTTACATDGVYSGGDVGLSHFTQIGRASVAPPTSRKTSVAEAPPDVSVDEARRRVEAYLTQAGFEPESHAGAGLYTISGDRMASAKAGEPPKAEAVCALRALERPQMYTTHVDVRLSPASAAGVQIGIEVKVVELDANLLSGAFSKQTCQSRGVLEAALRRAAFGG